MKTKTLNQNTDFLLGVGLDIQLRIGGYWFPRGGMPIDVFWQHGAQPDDVWVPDQGTAPYRGRS